MTQPDLEQLATIGGLIDAECAKRRGGGFSFGMTIGEWRAVATALRRVGRLEEESQLLWELVEILDGVDQRLTHGPTAELLEACKTRRSAELPSLADLRGIALRQEPGE